MNEEVLSRFARFRIAAIASLSLQSVASPPPANPFFPSGRQDIRLEQSFAQKPVPKWENGYFVAFDPQPEHAPTVTLFNSLGARLFQSSLEIDGTVRVLPRALAVSTKGTAAVAGSAYSGSGAGVSFLALLDATGKLSRIVRLDRFSVSQMCFTTDGRLWTVGKQIVYPGTLPPPDHDIVRIYAEGGKFDRSLLLRSHFRPGDKLHPAGKVYLAANKQHVVLFSAEAERLVGISYRGEVLFSHDARMPHPESLVTGFAVSGAAEILMSCQIADSSHAGKQTAEFYKWNPSAKDWSAIYSFQMGASGGYHALFGFEGEDLLVSPRLPSFSWVRLPQ